MNRRILYIYQEEQLKDQLEWLIKQEGFSLFCLKDETKIVSLLTVDPHFDFIMIQAETVGQKLIEQIQKVKSMDSGSILPVVLLLDQNNLVDQLSILEIGADDFIPVPLNPILLQLKLRILSNFLEMRDEMLHMKSKLMVFDEMQKIVTTISHYMNNALTPLINIDFQNPAFIRKEMMGKFQNQLFYLKDLIDLFRQIMTQKNLQTVDKGIYKGLLLEIENEVRQLKAKHKIK
jgi:DNA-binding NtrC family response regulator